MDGAVTAALSLFQAQSAPYVHVLYKNTKAAFQQPAEK